MSADGSLPQLPHGWHWSTIGAAGRVQLGRQRAPKYHQGPNMRPYLRVANVFDDRLNLDDVMEMDFPDADYERYRLVDGDILLNEGQTPELVGRAAMYRGQVPGVCFTNSLIRFQAGVDVDQRFALCVFRYYLYSGRFKREARITTNIAHLSANRFADIEFPLPPRSEQERIVAKVEDYLSRLNNGLRQFESALHGASQMRLALLENCWTEAPVARLGDLLAAPLKNGRSVPTAEQGFPVLRLTALRRGSIDVSEAKIGAWTADEARQYLVEQDDFLVARGNGSLSLIGRGGLVASHPPPVAFPDTLIRVRVDERRLMSRFLRLVWDSHRVRAQIEGQAHTSAGIYKVNQDMLRDIELPVPTIKEQKRLVTEVESQLAALRYAEETLKAQFVVVEGLKCSLLQQAFTGRLVPSSPSTDHLGSAGPKELERDATDLRNKGSAVLVTE